jgi:hypothetical protein
MNYGFNSTLPNWKEDKKEELYKELVNELKISGVGYSHNNYQPYKLDDPRFGNKPYIEMDIFGQSGVYIRKFPHLIEEDHKELVKKSDKVFFDIMGKEVQ